MTDRSDFNDLAQSTSPGDGTEAVLRILGAAFEQAKGLMPRASEKPAAAQPGKPATEESATNTEQAISATLAGDGFELRPDGVSPGVWRRKLERFKDGKPEYSEQFVCAPLETTHMVRDRNDDEWKRLVQFRNHDRRMRRVMVADEMLEGDGLALARLLRGKGLFIGDNKGGLLKMYVNQSRPAARARLTRRIGWHDDVQDPSRWSFVLPDEREPIAAEGAELWLFDQQGSGHAKFASTGTLADWQQHVARLAIGNSRLLFALSTGFAAGLCWLHPNIPGGFHWAGGSSLGKSALLYATASLCGPPSYRRTWLMTATGVEWSAAGHCDAPYLLDELKQAGNPRDVAQAAYMLASGQGKSRGQAAGGLRETAEFRLLFQSNGEIGLVQFLEENREKSYAGQEVRFCEIPGDAGAGMGAWEDLHGHADGARFSEAIQREAARFYGTAYPAFLARVVIERDTLQREFDKMRQQFESAQLTTKAGGQAIRAATRFAAGGFAGEMATEWGITGWKPGAAVGAAQRMFADWLHSFGGEENREPRRMVEQVRDWINANAPSRLADWRRKTDDHAPRTENAAGWRRLTKETANLANDEQVFEYLIYPGAFRAELANGFDPEQVAKELARRGCLEHDKARLMVKVREPGAPKPAWFYHITPAIKGGDDD
jgi:uncharacterized protein (DUF927 family)